MGTTHDLANLALLHQLHQQPLVQVDAEILCLKMPLLARPAMNVKVLLTFIFLSLYFQYNKGVTSAFHTQPFRDPCNSHHSFLPRTQGDRQLDRISFPTPFQILLPPLRSGKGVTLILGKGGWVGAGKEANFALFFVRFGALV